MFSVYPSLPRPLYHSPRVYSVYPDEPYLSSPYSRYRRALGEYLTAEEEYNALLRARKEIKLRARAEAVRRAQQTRLFKEGLAEAFARAAVSEDDDLSLHHVLPVRVMYRTSERPLSEMLIPSCMSARTSCADGTSAQKEKAQHDGEEDTSVNQTLTSPEPGESECSVPNLESVLRERLQKIAGDEEVQDLARAILRHLTSVTGDSPSAAAASSPEVNTYLTQPDEGAHLSRSHALKGAAAEAAKASFKAHRAEVAEKDEPSPASPSSLSIIQDIRSALTKLSSGFSPPPSLDFSDDEPDGLAYTPTNAPVRVYEHALNKLLERLDAVDSDGDEEVRVVRRAAVKEVEKAIEDVEKRIREARERAKPGTKAGSVVPAEADLTEGKNIDGAVDENPSVDKSKPEGEAEEPSSNSDDHMDSTRSGVEILPLPNPEVAILDVANTTDAMSVQDADILDNQSSTPVVPVATPSLASTDHIEASVSTEVSSDDGSESKLEALAQQATTNQVTCVPAPSEVTPLITPLDSPLEVSSPIFGAIAPSSTPVSLLVPSIIPEHLPVSLSHNRLSVPPVESDADEDEDEWTEI